MATITRPLTQLLSVVFAAITLMVAGSESLASDDSELATKLCDQIGVSRGIVVLVGSPSLKLPVELAKASELTVCVQLADAERVAKLRAAADRAGLLGSRLYVEKVKEPRVLFGDNLLDAVAVLGAGKLPQAELLRALRPGGTAIVGGQVAIKPTAKGSDDWSHPYHGADNNPQSSDSLAKAPYITQFYAEPFYGPMPQVTVVSAGRMFKAFGHVAYKEREWPLTNTLVAMNAFNGTELWLKKLTDGFMIHRNTIIASPDTLYLADNASCKLIDTATGKIKDEIVAPKSITKDRVWKWMAIEEGVLYALLGGPEQKAIVRNGTRTKAGWPWSEMGPGYSQTKYPWGFGNTLLAIDLKTKQVLWSHHETQPLDSRATCMSNGRLFFFSHGKFLAALETHSGQVLWKTSNEAILKAVGEHDRAQTATKGYSSQTYAKCNDRAIYFAGPQRRALVAVSASDGKLLWQHPHGNFQLILRDDGVYAMGRLTPSLKFDSVSGKVLAELNCYRGNCTRATATVDSIFTRGYRHSGTQRFILDGHQSTRIPLMRPACQDGVVVAGGLLYWGPWMCDCNLQLVGVISLASAGKFDFEQKATDQERLESLVDEPRKIAQLESSASDWATYRGDNLRNAGSSATVASRVEQRWQYQPTSTEETTAAITIGDMTLIAGGDGAVRAFASATGKPRWTTYTGGRIFYPPSYWQGRVYVGSNDGWIYALEASSGRTLWRFRAAPQRRKIPVYGDLSSTWPVASGVIVNEGVVYAAAGIASYDGTHVYALDAVTGKLRWQNNSSGRLLSKELASGVSVQGHLLLKGERLYLAGGNMVSPAVYDAKSGKFLSQLHDQWSKAPGKYDPKKRDGQWHKAPRGRELFVVDDTVMAFDQLLYSPKPYQQGRYFNQDFAQAKAANVLVRGRPGRIVRIGTKAAPGKQPQGIWENTDFARTAALAVTKNAVLALGQLASENDEKSGEIVLAALDSGSGKTQWTEPLPAAPLAWGLAVARDGQILVSLQDGRLLCFSAKTGE